MPQIINRGANKYLVRIFMGRRDGRRVYVSKTITGTLEDAVAFSCTAELTPSTPKARENCYIYAVQMEDGYYRYIKIGKSNSPLERVRNLQCGMPFPLKLIAEFKAADLLIHEEVLIHEKFRRLQIKGEWFRPSSDLIQWLQARASGKWIPQHHLQYLQSGSIGDAP